MALRTPAREVGNVEVIGTHAALRQALAPVAAGRRHPDATAGEQTDQLISSALGRAGGEVLGDQLAQELERLEHARVVGVGLAPAVAAAACGRCGVVAVEG